ncbi:arginine metabolism regulation protein ii [Colletotrichum incanum]|uniref:Arginine metabolism regulation protein ii n=1 Tax=Colletotrichum incanum TaxID=1573173 RepID=A0A166LIY3_COLIC|nr:arginine metabolism regulation protein ii [Colletotrichum incanum]
MEYASPLFGTIDEDRPVPSHRSSMADRATERHPEKTAGRKRQKTFTGCWTCRQRHVKCDEQRPRCKRCSTGNFACQGYGTRLTWLAPTSQGGQKSGGRNRVRAEAMPSSGIPKQPSNQEVSSTINIPVCSPFSAFRAFEPRPTSETRRSADQRRRTTKAKDQASRDLRGANNLGLGTIQHNPINNPAVNKADRLEGVPNDRSISLDYDDAVHSVQDRREFDIWAIGNGSSWPLEGGQPPSTWHTFSQHKPNGGRGSYDSFDHLSISRMAHQANLSGHELEEGLVLHHKQLSFHHLMQNLNCKGHDERMASLATLCLWTLIHFITGTPGAWREVMKVTRNLLEEISIDTWNQSTTAALTYQSFSSAFALIQSQFLGRLEFPAPLKTNLPGVEMPKSQIMPAQSLELVYSFNTKLLQAPCLSPDELDQLEIEFALSTPEPSTDFDARNADSAMVHHHRSLFYYASLLYFKCNSGRRGPEQEIQNMVARCMDHMEHLELLQNDSSPNTWIYAAVAFEAATPELRYRMRYLFSKRKSLGIATWDTLLLAVEKVWMRRDTAHPGFAPEAWTRILAEMPEFDVILY